MMRILSQGICVSDYHIVYFEYLRVVFVNYSSIKHKKEKNDNFTQSRAKRKIRGKRRKLNQFRKFHISIIEVTERENRQK